MPLTTLIDYDIVSFAMDNIASARGEVYKRCIYITMRVNRCARADNNEQREIIKKKNAKEYMYGK